MSSSRPNGKYGGNDKSKRKIDKKGVIITLIIVVGIIGASFIVWLLPSGNNQHNGNNNDNNVMVFSNPNDTLVAVNNQYILLKNELINQIRGGSSNIASASNTSSYNLSHLKNSIDASISQNNGLMQSLLNGNPSGSLIPTYVKMMSTLKNFSFYLDDLKNMTSNASLATASSSKNLTKDLISLQTKWSIQ